MTTQMMRYPYIKKRYQFGKQCVFTLDNNLGVENIPPNPSLADNYILRTRDNRQTQTASQLAAHEVQTKWSLSKNTGVCHLEGGWPKEINMHDNEVTYKYRRRIQKKENWVSCLKNMLPKMEQCVLQNGTVNIYEEYFDDLIPTAISKFYDIRIQNLYNDPQEIERPVSHLSWSPCGTNRLAVAYSFREFEEHPTDTSPYSYVWDIGNSIIPLTTLKSSCPCITIEFNPRDPAILLGGLMSGEVCCWDTRISDAPHQMSHRFHSHRTPVSQVVWIPSKVNTEFFSASMDGKVMWWDTRYPKSPSDTLVMDLSDPERADIMKAVGVTALQYEQTLSSRFLAGMENGMVVSVNRKTNNRVDKLASRYRCCTGPIIAIDRNPSITKNFLTIGDGYVEIWAEDTKEGSFFTTSGRDASLSGGCWSRSRLSVFFTINYNGMLKAYDILSGIHAPLATNHVCESNLTAICAHENGELIAVGNHNGQVYMMQCSEDLRTFTRNERNRLISYLERYGRYEKALDGRMRETRVQYGIVDLEEKIRRKRSTKTKSTKRDEKMRRKDAPSQKESRELMKRKMTKFKGKSTFKTSEAAMSLAEVEYFRRVEMEAQKFTPIEVEDFEAAQEVLKIKAASLLQIVKDGESDDDSKKTRRSVRKVWSRTRIRRDIRKHTKEETETAAEEMDSDMMATRAREERRRRVLKKICKTEICKPDICCKDMEDKLKARRAKMAEKYKMIRKLPERVKSTLIEDRLFRRLTVQLDRIPEPSREYRKQMVKLKNMPPDVLRKELEQAKQEVRVWQDKILAGQLSSWDVQRRLEEPVEKRKDAEEEQQKSPELEQKPRTTVTRAHRVSMSPSKSSMFRRRRTTRKKTGEDLLRLKEQKRQEMWRAAKEIAKMYDQMEGPGLTYPRISAVKGRLSTSEPDMARGN